MSLAPSEPAGSGMAGFVISSSCFQICYLDLLLQPFQRLHKFAVVLVGVVQLDFHLIQVCLHLLLEPKCLCPALGLRLQAGL